MKSTLHFLAVLILATIGAAAKADVTVLIDTRSSSTEQFLATVYTRHADLHNGYSRVRFEGLVPANTRRKVAIDFYPSLVGHAAWAYHPDYHVESVITHSRSDDLPPLVAHRWDAILEGAKALPYFARSGRPEGPSYFRLLAHVEAYGRSYLPVLDRAGIDPDPAVLPRFAALLERADALAAATTDADRRGEARLKEQRARVLPSLEKLLALTRSQRLAVTEFRKVTLGPKSMVAALQEDAGYPSLLAFIGRANVDHSSRLPQEHSWENSTGLRYTFRLEQWYRRQSDGRSPDCARGQVTLDARPVGKDTDPDLVKRVRNVSFCRDSSGLWVIDSRMAH